MTTVDLAVSNCGQLSVLICLMVVEVLGVTLNCLHRVVFYSILALMTIAVEAP